MLQENGLFPVYRLALDAKPDRVMLWLTENTGACSRIFSQPQHQCLARDILHQAQGVYLGFCFSCWHGILWWTDFWAIIHLSSYHESYEFIECNRVWFFFHHELFGCWPSTRASPTFVQFAKIRVKHESNCFLGSLSAKFDRFVRFVLKITYRRNYSSMRTNSVLPPPCKRLTALVRTYS